jgi:iron complex transport system substrate-binding protein
VNRVPQRIVCLSAESADWLWRIGAWDRVVGVTGFFQPPANTPPKPRVSGFSTARVREIVELAPDLVITFSDVQACIAADLIKAGLPVLATNQRTLAEIEATLRLLGRAVGCEDASERLLDEFRAALAAVPRSGPRPRVYFEEWNEPLISGIAWVSELIERAGGRDIFAHLQSMRAASERVVTSEQIVAADPEIIFASWCGKPVHLPDLAGRDGWSRVSAVIRGAIHEIPSEDILVPGFPLAQGFKRLKEAL